LLRALSALGDTALVLGFDPTKPVRQSAREFTMRHATEVASTPVRSRASSRIWAKIPGMRGVATTRSRYVVRPAFAHATASLIDRFQPDVIVARYTPTLLWSDPPHPVPVLLDADDDEVRIARAAALASERRVDRTYRRALASIISAASHRARRSADLTAYAARADAVEHGGIHLPNVYPTVGNAPPPSCGLRLLLVGLMAYAPNRKGFSWFLDEVWPDITANVPGVSLRVVGRLPKPVPGQWRRTGVSLAGWVDDLHAEYAEAALTIAPVVGGSGTNIKVLESLAHGRVCVTNQGDRFEGALDSNSGMVNAVTASQMASDIIQLLGDVDYRRSLESQGPAAVEEHFSPAALERALQEAVERLGVYVEEVDG